MRSEIHGRDLFGRAVAVAARLRGAARAAADHLAAARRIQRIERPWLQLLRVVLSTLEVAAFFLATVYLPLADVITYYLASPIFVTALSGIVLGERVGWRRWTAILIGFCGVLIALRPSTQTVSWPAMIALGGSLSFAFLMLITRSLRATPDIVLTTSQFGGTFCSAR
jgi:drug/metabolite transporter (DMT)-like permease